MFRSVDYSKLKVEVWLLLVFIVCGSLVFLYMSHLPVPATNWERLTTTDAVKLKSDIKDCEEKSVQTKLYLANVLSELSDLRQEADKDSSREGILPHTNEDFSHVFAIEEELRKVKKLYSEIRSQSGVVSGASNSFSIINQEHQTVTRRALEVSNYIPTYDFSTIKPSPSYDLSPEIECWSKDCSPEILNNHEAYTSCDLFVATTWNALGVKNMERYVSFAKNYTEQTVHHAGLLLEAREAFQNAVEIDPNCWRASVNLALVLIQYNDGKGALRQMEKAIAIKKTARNLAIYGFVQDFNNDREGAAQSWKSALEIDPYIAERKYFGIMVVDDTQPDKHIQFPNIREYSKEIESQMAADVLTFIEFSTVSAGNYGAIKPGAQEFFVKNMYIIIRDIIPPFVLRAVANCFKRYHEAGLLFFGDHQSNRYHAYNTRAGRTLHFQIVDLVRRIVLHNVYPTYSFFGGYIPGAVLPPHTDKPQCEFTITLTLQNYPENSEPWPISLGITPKFIRDPKYVGTPGAVVPPENEIVDAYLEPGDALLFMGRHLVHFRRTSLPENQRLDQIFFHHVAEDFEEIYDI